jgi:hypothetical protein
VQGVEIVSSDEIRKETNPDGETPGSQAGIFHRVRTTSSKILEEGRDVIVDAMHIEAEDRLRQISIAPPDVGIKYVIDRPLADKLKDARWPWKNIMTFSPPRSRQPWMEMDIPGFKSSISAP